jgi:phosphoglycolate phosphatase-like HAD superfamily hydrolase
VKRLIRHVLRRGRRAPAGPFTRPKLLIFDFDGTLADTFAAGLEILNVLAGEFGFRPLAEADVPKARDMRTRQLMKFLGIPMAQMSRIARRGSEELTARMPGITPLPGVPELLHALKDAGFELGIVTSNSEANVRMFLQKHELEFFAFIRSSSKLLGKSRELRAVMKSRQVAAHDILFIGDETRDIDAAQKAGIRMAAVTWGYNSARSIEAMKPDFLFAHPGDLTAFLAESRSAGN